MPLPWREKLKMLMPPSLFYRRRIAQEIGAGERPRLAPYAGNLTGLSRKLLSGWPRPFQPFLRQRRT